jgi:hypothetical protein
MRDREPDREPATVTPAPPLLPPPRGRCQICGAPHDARESILCRVCHQPVLLCGWA